VKELMPYITRSFYSMRWQDVLDILIVSFIIYQFVLMVKGTRAFKMLLGLAVFVMVTFLSQWLKMQTLNWLFSNFWQMGVIILVIVFQPELRKALAQVGTTPFYLGSAFKEEVVLKEIVEAAHVLATRKIGGLIVLKREMGLKNYIDSGIRINADVTEELLISIFLPYSPLHDGAAIIEYDKILAASCILPLSTDPVAGKVLGTRHRAALGLSEETDAVVVVISEETGSVSVAIGGKLTRELDKSSLLRVLNNLFLKRETKKGRHRLIVMMENKRGV
jgi:diadenylate cyclase